MGLLRIAAIGAVAAAFLAAGGSASHNPGTIADPVGDSGDARDILALTVTHTAAGAIRFAIDIANAQGVLRDDDRIGVFINADGDAGTGPRGFEHLILSDATPNAGLGRWDGSAYQAVATVSRSWTRGRMTLETSRADLGGPKRIELFVLTRTAAGGENVDVAPDNEVPLTYTLSTPHIERVETRFAPASPRAGRRFVASAPTLVLETAERVRPVRVRCRARVAGRPLVGSGAGGCAVVVPRTASGKRLVVTISASTDFESLAVTRAFTVR